MIPAQTLQLRTYADVIVRVGLNLQPGQRLLITDPYDLQGVPPALAPLTDALAAAATAVGGAGVDIEWGDAERVRRAVQRWPERVFATELERATTRRARAIKQGDALLFLQGSYPALFAGIPASRVARWRGDLAASYAQLAPALLAGQTNWTAAPAPTAAWAQAVFANLGQEAAEERLWDAVFSSCRVDRPDPVAAWEEHLASLAAECDALNRQRLSGIRFTGPGTDLRLNLPASHVWCTAQLHTTVRLPFCPNLPTEEIFTAPARDGTEGNLRVARPVYYAGSVIDGIELEFRRGRVASARARTGEDLLRQLLRSDDGAARLGEVALVPQRTTVAQSGVCFLHPLLDENALNHVALGDAYVFTAGAADAASLNSSALHLDLPLETTVQLDPR